MFRKLGSLAAVIAVLGGLSFNVPVQAQDFKVAIVDVPQVVNASAKVQALKKEQQAKVDEIIKFIENARKDVASITDANKKKTAEEKYTKELQAKKDKMDRDYAEKLKAIDTSISDQIAAQAKLEGYNVVLSKGMVLYGGDDITAKIIKVVK